ADAYGTAILHLHQHGAGVGTVVRARATHDTGPDDRELVHITETTMRGRIRKWEFHQRLIRIGRSRTFQPAWWPPASGYLTGALMPNTRRNGSTSSTQVQRASANGRTRVSRIAPPSMPTKRL